MEEKQFDEWNEAKKKLHYDAKRPVFKEREIWWYTIIGTPDNKSCVLLSQAGSFSAYRLLKRISKASVVDYTGVISKLEGLLFKKTP